MNTNTVFTFEFVSSSDRETDESTNKKEDESDEIDSDQHHRLSVHRGVRFAPSQQTNCPNGHLNSSELLQCQKLNHQIKANFDYQLQQHHQRNFNRQLSQRLTQHLNSLHEQSGQNFFCRLKTVNGAKLRQSRLFGFCVVLLNYHRASLTKLNLKLIYLIHLVVYYLQFLVTDVFNAFVFKYLLPNRYQRKVLVNWLARVTSNDLIRSSPNCFGQWVTSCGHRNLAANSANSIEPKTEANEKPSLTSLFGDGRLLCGLVEHLNAGACPRYDLLDSNDVHTNLDLAYRLILTYYGLDEKLNLVNLNTDEAEQKLISLISKIRYIEVKRELCARYEIEDQMSRAAGKSSVGLFDFLLNSFCFTAIMRTVFEAVRSHSNKFNKFELIRRVLITFPRSYRCKRIT